MRATPAVLTWRTATLACLVHLIFTKAFHDIYYNRQNAQQYIDLEHPCSTENRHRTQLPTM